VLVTMRTDGQPSTSVVRAGILPHPVSGEPVVAFAARCHTVKLGSVRRILGRPHDTEIHPGHGPDTAVGQERPHVGSGSDAAGSQVRELGAPSVTDVLR
jgi:hypothetical protein